MDGGQIMTGGLGQQGFRRGTEQHVGIGDDDIGVFPLHQRTGHQQPGAGVIDPVAARPQIRLPGEGEVEPQARQTLPHHRDKRLRRLVRVHDVIVQSDLRSQFVQVDGLGQGEFAKVNRIDRHQQGEIVGGRRRGGIPGGGHLGRHLLHGFLAKDAHFDAAQGIGVEPVLGEQGFRQPQVIEVVIVPLGQPAMVLRPVGAADLVVQEAEIGMDLPPPFRWGQHRQGAFQKGDGQPGMAQIAGTAPHAGMGQGIGDTEIGGLAGGMTGHRGLAPAGEINGIWKIA